MPGGWPPAKLPEEPAAWLLPAGLDAVPCLPLPAAQVAPRGCARAWPVPADHARNVPHDRTIRTRPSSASARSTLLEAQAPMPATAFKCRDDGSGTLHASGYDIRAEWSPDGRLVIDVNGNGQPVTTLILTGNGAILFQGCDGTRAAQPARHRGTGLPHGPEVRDMGQGGQAASRAADALGSACV